jgi:hypothetical protein
VACGASKSLSCRPWDAASSPAPNGWVPDEGVLSGSPRLRLVLNVLARPFQIWRIAFLIDSSLLVFDRQFDLSNFSSTRLLSLFQLSRRSADQLFIILSDQNGMFQEWRTVREVAGLLFISKTARRLRDRPGPCEVTIGKPWITADQISQVMPAAR